MSELLPGIGASGQWRLKPPFNTQIVNGLAYTCRAINKLGVVLATGINALEEYYLKNGLLPADYEADLAADVSIITLLSSSGKWLMVPSPYLDGWPSGDAIPYVVVGMLANLGALPNTVDPHFLKEKIDNVIKAALGHDPEVEFVTLSEVTNKPWTEHVALENARTNMITDTNTDYVMRLKAEAALADAKVQIQALQKFINDSGIMP